MQSPSLSLEVGQREVSIGAGSIVGVEFRKGCGELGIVDARLHVLITRELREFHVRRRRLVSHHWLWVFTQRLGESGRHFLQSFAPKVSLSRQIGNCEREVKLMRL